MAFKQIIINIDSKNADPLSDIFSELNALSVSIEDQYEGTALEQPIFNEPGMEVAGLWQHSKVLVLLDCNTNLLDIVAQAQQKLGCDFEYLVEDVDDQDWVRLTQNQFQPIRIRDDFYIVPSWHVSPNPDAKTITLDPGLAFGTGSHPTTFMCLQWIAQHVNKNHSVLDYGCGSGILAIAAKKFAAHTVFGVDIDEQALISSKANAENNKAIITFSEPNKLLSSYDIVIANILSNPLRILAPILANLTKSKLILSGILSEQAAELTKIYSKWFNVKTANESEGWVLLECNIK